jgi:hypothetical protein
LQAGAKQAYRVFDRDVHRSSWTMEISEGHIRVPAKEKAVMNTQLGGLGDGEYDLFGLDEFGNPDGNPMWGALAGGVVSTGTAMALRAFTGQGKWAEGIGALAGAAAGGVMMAMGQRAAGTTAIAVALVTGGLRQVESLLSKNPLAGFGIAEIAKGYAVNGVSVQPLLGAGNGFGLATIDPTHQVLGAGQMPELLGAANGGPPAQLVGLGSHFGATLFG